MTDELDTLRFTTTLAIAGVTNANGYRYTKEALDNAVKYFETDNQPVLAYAGPEDSLQNAGMICKRLEFCENAVVGTLQTLTNPTGLRVKEIVEQFGSNVFQYGLSGVAKIEEDGRITEFQLRSIGIMTNGHAERPT